MKIEETAITRANGGIHSKRALLRLQGMIAENEFISPRLYHLIFMGSQTIKPYQDALKALCFELRRKGMPCEWRACAEDEKDKGLHVHIFMLVESRYVPVCGFINHRRAGWLNLMMQRRSLTYHIAPPKNKMHLSKKGKQLRYATLAGDKREDCKNWISYLAKARSKCPDIKQTYFSSRNSPRQRNAPVEAMQQ